MRDALYSTFIKVLQSLCLALLFGSLDMDRNKNNFSEIDLSSNKESITDDERCYGSTKDVLYFC